MRRRHLRTIPVKIRLPKTMEQFREAQAQGIEGEQEGFLSGNPDMG
jgi:hypothetical protein